MDGRKETERDRRSRMGRRIRRSWWTIAVCLLVCLFFARPDNDNNE